MAQAPAAAAALALGAAFVGHAARAGVGAELRRYAAGPPSLATAASLSWQQGAAAALHVPLPPELPRLPLEEDPQEFLLAPASASASPLGELRGGAFRPGFRWRRQQPLDPDMLRSGIADLMLLVRETSEQDWKLLASTLSQMHDFVEALLRKERAEHTYPGKLPDSEFWDALAGSLSDIARRPDSMVMWQSMLNEDSSGSEDEAEAYDQDDYEDDDMDLGEALGGVIRRIPGAGVVQGFIREALRSDLDSDDETQIARIEREEGRMEPSDVYDPYGAAQGIDSDFEEEELSEGASEILAMSGSKLRTYASPEVRAAAAVVFFQLSDAVSESAFAELIGGFESMDSAALSQETFLALQPYFPVAELQSCFLTMCALRLAKPAAKSPRLLMRLGLSCDRALASAALPVAMRKQLVGRVIEALTTERPGEWPCSQNFLAQRLKVQVRRMRVFHKDRRWLNQQRGKIERYQARLQSCDGASSQACWKLQATLGEVTKEFRSVKR